jgi:hypothetical protein
MTAPFLRIVAGTALADPVTTQPAPSRPMPSAAAVEHVSEKTLSSTYSNGQIREQLRDVWREAEAIRQYWRMRLKMHDAIASVQDRGLAEGNNHRKLDAADRWTLLANWRAAIACQLLTAAPDVAA